MNENLIKGLVKLKLGMIDSMIDHLPEAEAKEVRKLGKLILQAAGEYQEDPIKSKQEKSSDGKLTQIDID